MSRIGRNPVPVPDGVSVSVEGSEVAVKGRLGELRSAVPEAVGVTVADGAVRLAPRGEGPEVPALWGLARALVANMVTGVSEGFVRHLEIEGTGYRAAVKDGSLVLALGFSHEIHIPVPDDIEVACPRPVEIEIRGRDRQRVGQFAAEVRAFRRPEPYKGKGIRYRGEYVRRKEGKAK